MSIGYVKSSATLAAAAVSIIRFTTVSSLGPAMSEYEAAPSQRTCLIRVQPRAEPRVQPGAYVQSLCLDPQRLPGPAVRRPGPGPPGNARPLSEFCRGPVRVPVL